MKIEVRDLSWAVEGTRILVEIALACAPGMFVGLVGPNGSGKSSLLRCIYRVTRPDAGVVTVDDRDVWALTARDLARRIGVVLQERPSDTAFTVREVVLMGRGPHKSLLERDTPDDHRQVESAMHRAGVQALAARAFDTLSGGEKQRVLMARVLAQTPRLLVLDEPTTHLDLGHQIETLRLVRRLGVTTIAALHDLNLAAAYCDELVMLERGSIRAHGAPFDMLTASLIEQVYGVRATVGLNPLTGKPHLFVDGAAGER